jgi:precorrin-6A synthase
MTTDRPVRGGRRILIIGIGAGNPEHITIQAINALKKVDVLFLTDKGADKSDLLRVRKEICERYVPDASYRVIQFNDPERERDRDRSTAEEIPRSAAGNRSAAEGIPRSAAGAPWEATWDDRSAAKEIPRSTAGATWETAATYRTAVEDWHSKRAALYEKLIREHVGDGECGAFLCWGDPTLYDSILRILDPLSRKPAVAFEYEVIPGISSLQALAARHRIPLNQIAEPLQVTTGRRLLQTLAECPSATDVVVVLDGECSFKHIADGDFEIYWGAYLGMPDELLVSGKVRDVGPVIERLRAEARARKGWIMDTYLLRRPAHRA